MSDLYHTPVRSYLIFSRLRNKGARWGLHFITDKFSTAEGLRSPIRSRGLVVKIISMTQPRVADASSWSPDQQHQFAIKHNGIK